MLNRTKDPTPLETATTTAIQTLSHYEPQTEEYGVILERVEKLHDMSRATKAESQVSPETKATIAANLVGIAMILNYEHAHVVTSKALGFILRAR